VRGQEHHDSQAAKAYYRYIEHYDWVDVADHLKGVEALIYRKRARLMRRLIAKYSIRTNRHLDLGCGTGLILRHLPSGSIGLDINLSNLEKVAHYVPTALLTQGDAENLPFRDGSFDMIVCTEVLEHLPNPSQAITEISRCLAKDGVLIGSVPHVSPLWRMRFLSSTCPREDPFHNTYRKSEVRKLLEVSLTVLHLRLSILGMAAVFVARKTHLTCSQ